MAQHRQSGTDRCGPRGHDLHHSNSYSAADHVSVGIRNAPHKQGRTRRWVRSEKTRRLSIEFLIVVLFLVLLFTVLAYYYISTDNGETTSYEAEGTELNIDSDFLTNVTRFETKKVLNFGKGSVAHGLDSRYWDRDDRRRDEDYNEDVVEHIARNDEASDKVNALQKSSLESSSKGLDRKGVGLYNEAGRNELKKYEAEYEASLNNSGKSTNKIGQKTRFLGQEDQENWNKVVDIDDEYDDGIDTHDAAMEEYDDKGHEKGDHSGVLKSYRESHRESINVPDKDNMRDKVLHSDENNEESSMNSSKASLSIRNSGNSRHSSVINGQSTRRTSVDSKKKSKRRRFSGPSCEMNHLNSTAHLVEPLESQKFSRFTLQYTEIEERPEGQEHWEPRFAGHQSLQEREMSFLAQDQKIDCGFVKGPKGYPATGFDLAEDDANYMSRCHIAVISCIFGNSDHLRIPTGKAVTRLSRKNVCFVMFIDEVTLEALSADGKAPDRMGFVGLWKLVVAKNLPYTDMRRVGKIPKLLTHRLFPSASYSIWLDSKLRLQLDPLLILEYFLWRKGYEYAISNHYDRHCVWEEVAQNKKLNKYNHTIIDQQFAFYQADGLKRFDASDPDKLLPSNVPEGSFIIRAHTPMSNLFSCLWFNEVDRFTPRDQLSFAYTYQKLRKVNPGKPFHLNMFKDCERRTIAKLYRHRTVQQQ